MAVVGALVFAAVVATVAVVAVDRVRSKVRREQFIWHKFILFTREYHAFCETAFGKFLRRVWRYCCLEENINPRKATRLPLLFALDRKLGIENGFVYNLNCERAPARDGGDVGMVMTTQCATAFTDKDVDGTTDGLGCSSGCGGD